jgi:DNA gyrase subunit A
LADEEERKDGEDTPSPSGAGSVTPNDVTGDGAADDGASEAVDPGKAAHDGSDGGGGNGAGPPDGGDDGGGAGDVSPISIEEEMKASYLDYAMSVIVSRALPDVRDGLKPVHRRILFSMNENGYDWNKPYRKSARVVGDVIGKYHPHGDQSIYDALVRMAQDFSLRLPLLDGQGNFGSVDGDPPAAMRYTEVRMGKPAHALLEDIDKNTVDFQDNYDNSEREPTVLPARFPNLLVNGSGGIAVGMATNMAPHNLGEVIEACVATIENPAIGIEELNSIVPGPDFPTGGLILGRSGIRSAYETGRGSVLMRARVAVEEIRKDREALIVSEIPYQVNKASMIEKIAEQVRDKKVEGISDIRDESDRHGMRVVIELKRDAVADVVLNQLWRYSQLQTSFGINAVALTGGRPELMNLKDLLQAFISFREEVVTRRTKFLLGKARDRAHILVGLAIAVANIDEVIALIRTAPDPATAREQLMARAWPARDMEPLIKLIDDPRHMLSEDGTYRLSEEQARAILELRLQRLTALGRDEISEELHKLGGEISDYLEILRSRARVLKIITDELIEVKEEFGTPRRTEIVEGGADMEDEDLIQSEDMVVTVSHGGYIKRVPLDTYRAQRRGGKGRSGMQTKEEDFVTRLFVANTHTPVLFFSSRGMVYQMKVWRLPLAAPHARGKALINLLPLVQGERVTTIMPLPVDEAVWGELDVMFATVNGNVRRNKLSDFIGIRQNGKIAMKLAEGDQIAGVETCTDQDDVLLTSYAGQCIRFSAGDVRVFKGRDSMGVRGINLGKDDRVISLSVLRHFEATSPERIAFLKQRRAGEEVEDDRAEDNGEDSNGDAIQLTPERYAEMLAAEQIILTVSTNGYGKRTSSHEYRTTGRGGKGIVAMTVNKRNGPLVASFPVGDEDEIMLVSDGGQLIRCPVAGIRIAGRSTQGVTIFDTAEGEHVVSVERISDVDEDDDDGDEPNGAVDAGGEA